MANLDPDQALIPAPQKCYTAGQMVEMLRAHYIPETKDVHARDGGVFAHEVSMNGNWGGRGSRRADALYAGFTSASGRILVGHEIKVSRSDWRSELAHLDKADAWADACHAWFIVAPSTDIVPIEELPDGWGLMLPPKTSRGRRMRIVAKARVKQDHAPPWWAVRSFMARLETLQHGQLAEKVGILAQERVKDVEKRYQERLQDRILGHEDQQRLNTLLRLEESLGMTITDFRDDLDNGRVSLDTLTRALRLATQTRQVGNRTQHLHHAVRQLDEAVQEIKTALPAVQAYYTGEDPTDGS